MQPQEITAVHLSIYFLDGVSFSHKLSQIVMQLGNTSELQMGFCTTVTNSSLVVAQCPYHIVYTHKFSQHHLSRLVLPHQLDQVNNSICAPLNRKGFLCAVNVKRLAAYHQYSFECVKCSTYLGIGLVSFSYSLLLATFCS